MTVKIYGKLVRDRIPELIEKEDKRCSYYTATPQEYREALLRKLREEVEEFVADPSCEELADVYEVLESVIRAYKLSSVFASQIAKRVRRGSFTDQVILEWVEE